MPLARPTTLIDSAFDLRLAFNVNGAWDWNWSEPSLGEAGLRLRIDEISHGMNGTLPTAKLSLCLAGRYDDDGNVLLPQLGMAELDGLVPAGAQLVIYAQSFGQREFLFAGQVEAGKLKWSGQRGSEGVSFEVICTSLLERLAREPQCWIRGRHVHHTPREGESATFKTQFCDGLACIFNFKGQPNRAATMADIAAGETTIKVPVFTYDGDPTAKYWRWADVLTYLLHFYLTPLGDNYLLQDGNGQALCAALVAADAAAETPDDANALSLSQVLGSRAEELTAQSVSVVTALQRLCALAGMGMQQWTMTEMMVEPASKLCFWLLGDGGPFQADGTLRTDPDDDATDPRSLALELEGSTAAGRDPADFLRMNELTDGEISFDSSPIVNSANVIGRVDLFEVTMGERCATLASDIFKPLWQPDTLFGDSLNGSAMADKLLQIDRVAAEASGDDLTMFNRYTRGGSGHADNLKVGRLWGLNESGEYGGNQGADYARTNGGASCWNTDAYKTPYNFHANCDAPRILEGAENEDGIDWFVRRRKFLQPLSRLGENKLKIAPLVYASWNSGATWYEYPGAVRFLEDQCSLLLLDDNLAKVTNEAAPIAEAGARDSVWAAIIKGTFRLAVTASIEGDQRVVGTSSPANTFGAEYFHREVNAHEHFRREQRCNSELVGHAGYNFTDVDEETSADALANRMVFATRSRLIAGTVVTPWLRSDWLPGERCAGIEPRGVVFIAAAGDESGGELIYPSVVAVRWINNGANQATQLTFDDARRALSKAAAAEVAHREAEPRAGIR